jgi:hypothetical protein
MRPTGASKLDEPGSAPVARNGQDRGVSTTPPGGGRTLRRDPVLLTAVIVLAASAAVALVFTAVDRPAAPVPRAQPGPPAVSPALSSTPTPVAIPSSGTASPAASAVAGAVPPTDPSPTGPGTPECPASGVLVRGGGVDAAMGLRASGVELLNCGTRPYTVHGYPAVQVLDATGAALTLEVVNGRSAVTMLDSVDAPPRKIVLKPGKSAWSTLVWRSTARDGVRFWVVARPGEAPQTAAPSDGGIDLGDGGRLGVGPWRTVD